MALIKCPECDKEISDKVKACPHCGFPLVNEENDVQKVEVASVKLQKMNPKKKKTLLILSSSVVFLVVLSVVGFFVIKQINDQNAYDSAIVLLEEGKYQDAVAAFNDLGNYKDSRQKASQAYGENFEQTAALIYINHLLSQLKCYYISETWSDAIDNSRYGKDFNEEIQKLLKSWTDNGLTETAQKSKDDIDARMITLQNPVEDYAEAHKQLVEMYGLYVQMYEQSKSPTGSLLTFNSTVKSVASDFEKAYNQITVIKPTIKDKVEQEKDDIDPQDLV